MPVSYAYIIDELLHASPGEASSRAAYHARIVDSIIETGSVCDFIRSLAALIKRLAVDHVHVVGDLYDRGAHGDAVIDRLMAYHSLDIQWGNHDICWMGAAAGSEACVATVVRNCVHYQTLDILRLPCGHLSLRARLLPRRPGAGQDVLSGPARRPITAHPSPRSSARGRSRAIQVRHGRPPPAGWRRRLRGHRRISGRNYELVTRDFPTLRPSRA